MVDQKRKTFLGVKRRILDWLLSVFQNFKFELSKKINCAHCANSNSKEWESMATNNHIGSDSEFKSELSIHLYGELHDQGGVPPKQSCVCSYSRFRLGSFHL